MVVVAPGCSTFFELSFEPKIFDRDEFATRVTQTKTRASDVTIQLMYQVSITRKAVERTHKTICMGVPKTRKSLYL